MQEFDVLMRNVQTGEEWIVSVNAHDPAGALTKVLRRRRFAEALLSEQAHRFVVLDRLGEVA